MRVQWVDEGCVCIRQNFGVVCCDALGVESV